MGSMADRYYTDEQAQEILRMAARSSMGVGGVSQRQLLETAAELGISAEEVLQAERAYIKEKELQDDRKAFFLNKRKELLSRISGWLSLAAVLYGIYFATRGFTLDGWISGWPKWPVGITGLFLLKEVLEICSDMTVNRQSAFEKWRARQAKKAAKREMIGEVISSPNIPITDPVQEPVSLEQNQARS